VLAWNAPLNVDGSTIIDGDHYEIQHAPNPGSVWQNTFVGWGASTGQLVDLSPGVSYDVRIRAVDKSGNTGAWSATETFVATEDTIAPSTPAAPTVAASRIAVQITHQLGKASAAARSTWSPTSTISRSTSGRRRDSPQTQRP
jgi:hypothetical protein